jgi:hypothetical protein
MPVMTDGHRVSAQHTRSVVGLGFDKNEVKGAEGPICLELYSTSLQIWDQAMAVTSHKWRLWTGCDREDNSEPDVSIARKTEMAAMMARIDVAKRRRLRIVGAAKRDGQTAISHQHGKFVDLI